MNPRTLGAVWETLEGIHLELACGPRTCDDAHGIFHVARIKMKQKLHFIGEEAYLVQINSSITQLQIGCVKLTSINITSVVSSPNPMFYHL